MREKQRQARLDLRIAAQVDREARAAHAAAQVAALLDRVEAGGVHVAGVDFWQLLAGLGRLSPDHLGDLPGRLRKLELRDGPSDPAGVQALVQTRASITDRPWELLRNAAGAGHVRLATEFMWEVLYFDPDYEPIRKALGQQKVNPDKVSGLQTEQITGELAQRLPEIKGLHPNRYWFSAFDAARLKQGLWWDPRFGWIDAKSPDRYEKGYVYDLQRKQWTTLDEANAYHAKPGRDWVIRTEHMLIMGTADLGVLAEVADRLEALYDEIFRTFPGFFTESRRVDAMRYALGLAEHEPFAVWVYADHAEYVQRADAVGWSGGIFKRSNGTAYFYGRPSPTMYHEFTHQVLHVMTGGNRAPSWLTEGIAVYTQTVTFGIRGAEFSGAPADDSWSLDDLFALRGGDDWYRAYENAQRKNLSSPYGPAGSVVTFAMQYDDQNFQAEFVDFLRDNYRGRSGNHDVWEYLGMDEGAFRRAYAEWVMKRRAQ
ncbi:MAG: hypothetical protein R3C45_10060 [Phycisphaerales bacterium]